MTDLTPVPPLDGQIALDASPFSGEVHPYAAIFPMLPDEDLKALAEDIAANGQLHPILLTPEGTLIDGRNRLAACGIAGVEPRFEVTDQDPVALIMSANLQRRDLPKALKAFHAVASTVFQSGTTTRELAQIAGVPASRIAEAQIVLRFAPETFQAVLDGSDDPTPAYQAAKAEKDRLALNEKQTTELREKAPDLLSLALPEAWAAYQERTRKQREAELEHRDAARRRNIYICGGLAHIAAQKDRVGSFIAEYAPEDVPPSQHITRQLLTDAAATIAELLEVTK